MELPDLPRLGLRAAAEAQGLAHVLPSGLVGLASPTGGVRVRRARADDMRERLRPGADA